MGCAVPTHTSPQCWYVHKSDKNYEAEINLLYHDFLEDLEEIAKRAMEEFVKPFCDRHRLRFCCGMGVYTFYWIDENKTHPNDWVIAADDENDEEDTPLSKRAPDGYAAVRDVLLTPIPFNQNLYEYMEDYDPSEEGGNDAQDC